MLESLYGLPGKIKTLLDRLTAARAGYLDSINPAVTGWNSTRAGYVDRLDAAVSTRAPASTALSNATWTDARAGYQDRLDTTVSSRAPASTALSNATWTDARAVKVDNLDAAISSRSTLTAADVWAAGTRTLTSGTSPIKSVQRGVKTGSGTVTITAVNTAKAFVISYSKASAGTVAATGTVAASTLSGSITGTLSPSGGGTISNVYYVQYGQCATNSTAGSFPSYSGTRTLSGSTTSAAISGGTTDLTTKQYSAVLTNSTTLTCDGSVEWQVIEYI